MEKAPGIELQRVWEGLKSRDKLSVVKQVASITSSLAQARFPGYGSLYKKQDISMSESISVDDNYAIGPTVGRAWFDDRRFEANVHRRPWDSTRNLMNALAQREMSCLEKFSTFPQDCQQGIYNGPGGYCPTKDKKLSVLQDFLKLCPHILPKNDDFNAGILWHNDLHTDNIFVDANDPPRITSIIDWESVPVYPMFLIAHHPSVIDYEGPKPDGFASPELPRNFETLDPHAKKAAKALFLAQSFWLTWEIETQRKTPELLRASRYRDTLPGQILGMIGSIYDDGEPYVQTLLADITEEKTWKEVVTGTGEQGNPSVECPLKYSTEELQKQQLEYAKLERDVERKARVIEDIGVYPGWNGAVTPRDYDEVVERLATAKKAFLDRESQTNKERELWEKVWPFQ